MNTEKTGSFIRDLRKEKNLTQQQLAELINVSDKAVSRWETGRGLPDIGNLEDLSEALDVSVAEMLKGERFSDSITSADMVEVSSASFSAARSSVNRRKWQNLIMGFIAGMVILLLIVVHLTSPIYITGSENALSIEMLSNDEVAAVMKEQVSGYDLDTFSEPDSDTPMTFISCYDTLWNRILHKKNNMIISLGKKDDLGYVYYYPSLNGDQLIYKSDAVPALQGGVETLPRLVYNYWIFIGAGLSIIGIAACFIWRRKYFFSRIFKAAMVPVSFTISTVIVLMGHFSSIFNGAYYFSGILLMAILIYALSILLFVTRRERKRESEQL